MKASFLNPRIFFYVLLVNIIIIYFIYENNKFNIESKKYFTIDGNNTNQQKFKNETIEENLYKTFKVKPKCSCRNEITVARHTKFQNLYKINDIYIIFDIKAENITKAELIKKYSLRETDKVYLNPKFTCDLYNEISHGPNQKVIGYTLYGTHIGYYRLIGKIISTAQKLFPEWIVRVHYDKSINPEIICEMECKYNTVYFCNVNEVLFKYDIGIDLFQSPPKHDLSYIHGMMWRWFPITDDFVDFFSSRDSDSSLIQRERDSVDAWINSSTLFHVMRDNPYHNTVILGGLWGYANTRNRTIGNNIFKHFVNNQLQNQYNPGGHHSKGLDQSYLSEHVWQTARVNGTVHDSYGCHIYGGTPFPTRRATNMYCWVSLFTIR